MTLYIDMSSIWIYLGQINWKFCRTGGDEENGTPCSGAELIT
jgi:hypothetical protein